VIKAIWGPGYKVFQTKMPQIFLQGRYFPENVSPKKVSQRLLEVKQGGLMVLFLGLGFSIAPSPEIFLPTPLIVFISLKD